MKSFSRSSNIFIFRFPNGQQVQIKRLEYESGDRRFQQYPLRLAYAHTIERAQGATFDGIMLVRNHTWNPEKICS
ncbi:Protein CBG28108 [Caenorhabditis briggsae]|uniref:Protein CBG28108 n=1 Tax=Caenorhabditis briggsae TaxID=6238 RepID=B6IGU7_CAEBR|nr:Protein CBG28108 [Caenorhabditis briggsae]CAR99127.1 Protein CBG28108 [Caenorhabditis briggsae]